jgi:S-adenosylmethionine/arginine decarboxylase-like enzyme
MSMGVPLPPFDETSPLWGLHATFDLAGCSLDTIKNREAVGKFPALLCAEIGMKPYGPPLVELFGLQDPDTAGLTVVQLIETSSITGHFSPLRGTAYLDVFSCRFFNVNTVEYWLRTYFEANHCRRTVIRRGVYEPAVV